MARYTFSSRSWSAGETVSGDHTLQCIGGTVLVSVEASPGSDDGLLLRGAPGYLQATIIRDGDTVKWCSADGEPAQIVLEAQG